MTFSILTLTIVTLRPMAFSIRTLSNKYTKHIDTQNNDSILTLSTITFSITTLTMMTLSIMIFSIMTL